MSLGAFCLVLHGHLPYVLRHGRSPHGENWLFEAVAETYLPLLALVDELTFLRAKPAFALGLTPVLLEQLASDVFRKGFRAYLEERLARAAADRADFERAKEPVFVALADRWIEFYEARREQFEREGGDLCAAFARRRAQGLQILGSAATHAYLPLLADDSAVRAQIRAGLASSERLLGFRPQGFWLPECAYRPRGPWHGPVPWQGHPDRFGIERLLADEGVTHCFLEHRLVEQGRSAKVRHGDRWYDVDASEADKYPGQGWRSVHELHGIATDRDARGMVTAFARDARVCEQVWSGSIGYPADGAYLEFHKHRGEDRGLRYWKVTDKAVDLGRKQPYRPEDVPGRVHAQAMHFCNLVKDRLRAERARTGRTGLVVAAFDAELFGHWWFEGPAFLRDVLLTLNADPEVDVLTAEQALERYAPDKVLALPEGSWGEGSDHRVWADPRVHWIWEIEYRCEAMFGKLTYELPWRKDATLRELLQKAGRELLLLQASDWPFAITRGQAVDYGIKRFVLHVARFERLVDLCSRAAREPEALLTLDPVERHAVDDADLHDVVFPEVDLEWWNV
ncbi:MAG TPA: 1,4-alpha-glucan branching protein domain-containing protein [Planctomycetota bacterium]|nr:1,4-alpha-glucan branching protein domain-containing protein [Planctomycetota bacterium]